MSARKKTSKSAGKKPTPRKASTKKAPAKKASARPKATPGKATRPDSSPAASDGKGDVGVEPVTLGHIFALRPRVNTSFPQAEFLEAKRALAGERYGSIEEAARAVAEKALTGANRKPPKHSITRR